MHIKHWLAAGLVVSGVTGTTLACDTFDLPPERVYCTDIECLAAHVKLAEGATALKLLDVGTSALSKGVHPSSPGAAWAVGGVGTVLGWDGWAWTSWPSGTNEALAAVWGSDPNDVWAVGASATVIRWDGTRWSPSSAQPPVPATTFFRAVWGAGPKDVFMAGDSCTGDSSCTESLIVHWDGSTFTTQKQPARIYRVWGSAPKDVWASAANGKLFHHDGTTWSEQASGVSDHLLGLWGSSANDVYACGGFESGAVVHFDGTQWTKTSYADEGPAAIWGSGPTDVWVLGNQRAAGSAEPAPHAAGHAMHWDGASWTAFPMATADLLGGVSGASSSDIWTVGFEGIFHWNGAEWPDVVSVGEPLLDVFAFPAPAAAGGGPVITKRPPPALFADSSSFRTARPLDIEWTDETNLCRPGFCLSLCSPRMECVATTKCTGSFRDGVRSGTSHFAVSYDVDDGYVPDFKVQVTPVSAPGCPGDEPERLAAGDPAVVVGRSVSVEQGYNTTGVTVPAGTGGADGSTGGGGTCPGGWYCSLRSCLPLGAGGACECNDSPTNFCLTRADFAAQGGGDLPAACLPAGNAGCLRNDASGGTLIHPCCPGLSCVGTASCGGQAGGLCVAK